MYQDFFITDMKEEIAGRDTEVIRLKQELLEKEKLN